MSEVAAWVALVATCIAALLTAANLGARPTGWGFVIFATGAAAWVVVGLTTGQRQLLYSNVFLGLIDIFGIWRWLGHRAHVDDSAAAEVDRSEDEERERRFSVGKLVGLPVGPSMGQRSRRWSMLWSPATAAGCAIWSSRAVVSQALAKRYTACPGNRSMLTVMTFERR